MPLDDLQKKIYKPDSETASRRHEESQYDIGIASEAGTAEFQKEKEWAERQKGLRVYQKKVFKITALAILGVAVVSTALVAVYRYQRAAFSEERVKFEIKGPLSVASNQPMQYTVTYQNDNRVALKNAVLHLNYSNSFEPEETNGLKIENQSNSAIQLGEIAPHSDGAVTFTGRFYAPMESVVYLNGKLSYNPSNMQNVIQVDQQLGIQIKTAPLSVEIDAPFQVASGDRIEYVIKYKNTSSRPFEDARLVVEYPNDFKFDSSDPESSDGGHSWNLGAIASGSEGKVSILGYLSGLPNDGQVIRVSIGSVADGSLVVYNNQEKVTKIGSSPFSISQNVRSFKNINAGDKLQYTLKYKNVSELGLRNVIVNLEINSRVVDFRKLRLAKGYFDGQKTITWKAADYPNLASMQSGQEGSITFELPLLEYVPVEDEDDKNFVIETIAKIDSPDIPTPIGSNKIISSNQLSLKLNSKIIFEVKGFYKDAQIQNSGPIPPKVGEETTYAIHWKISNLFNDISGVKVAAFLPTGVVWKGVFHPDSEKISFNERTNEVVWEVGNLANGVGALTDAREIVFQVGVRPQINQANQDVPIVQVSVLNAKDEFTGQDITLQTKNKTTRLPEDTSIDTRTGYRVVQ